MVLSSFVENEKFLRDPSFHLSQEGRFHLILEKENSEEFDLLEDIVHSLEVSQTIVHDD